MRFNPFALAMAGILVLPGLADAKTYEIDTDHSSVEFSIRHLVARSSGRFTDYTGTIEFDENNPKKGTVSVTIKAASIDTDHEERDTHLRSADFLDVENHPEITFKGKTTKKTEDGFDVKGTLTIRGVSKEVVLPVELLGVEPDPWGNMRAGFYAELAINRKDFGVNWNKALDKGGFILGEKVRIRIAVEAVSPQPEAAES